VKILAVAGAAVLIVLGALSAVAYRAGAQFEQDMLEAQAMDPAVTSFRLRDVAVRRGLFSSSANAVIEIPGVIDAPGMPVELEASQGLALDGSVLRVRTRLGPQANSPLGRYLAALGGPPKPVEVRMGFGFDGTMDRFAADVSPLRTPEDGRTRHWQWGGAQMRMTTTGSYRAGGRSEGIVHSAPVEFNVAGPVEVKGEIGAMTQTFRSTGSETDMSETFELVSDPSTIDGPAGQIRVDRMRMRGLIAVHLSKDATADNPSGLPPGRMALKGFEWTLSVSKPVEGRIAVSGHLEAPVPDVREMQAKAPLEGISPAEAAFLRSLRGAMELRVSVSLLRGIAPPLEQRLLETGYLTRQGDDLVGPFVFGEGRVTLNGKLIQAEGAAAGSARR
jgi:hypothetical protein